MKYNNIREEELKNKVGVDWFNMYFSTLGRWSFEEWEKYPEKTLAQLYDPDKMPKGLKEAFRLNDEAVERCYRSKPLNSDAERLEYLLNCIKRWSRKKRRKALCCSRNKDT